TGLDGWLDTIHVYPKNAQIGAQKSVENADDLQVGDTVTWTIAADIPKNANPAATGPSDQFVAPTAFRIVDALTDSELTLDGATSAAIRVSAGSTALAETTDYTVATAAASGQTTYTIDFTATGLAKLATAINADANAEVTVELDTVVEAAAVIDNVANIYPDQKSITDNKPLTSTTAEARYG